MSARAPRWLSAAIVVFFGLFYAFDVWEAIGNLVGLNLAAQGLDTQLSVLGTLVLVLGALVPCFVFAGAFWLGHSRGVGVQLLLFVTGLALVAVLSLDMTVLLSLGRLIV